MERMVLSDLQLRTVISCTRQSNGYTPYTRQSTIAAPESPIFARSPYTRQSTIYRGKRETGDKTRNR
jgi:hypothetical protein